MSPAHKIGHFSYSSHGNRSKNDENMFSIFDRQMEKCDPKWYRPKIFGGRK